MFRRSLVSLAALVIFAGSSAAADRRYAFEQIELPNGLRVISLEDDSCPIVAVQVWYHVGAKDEDPARQGFAHMFEHMMFRGTDNVGVEEHFNHIRRVGGDCNAYTSWDQTVYVQALPSNQLELVLWLEAERMTSLKIDDENFTTERKVVWEELRQGHNQPYGLVPEKLLAEIYGDKPYGWTPGGQIEHLAAATVDELGAFWDRFYVPNNAALVVVGAVKHSEVQALAKKYFGWIPRCPDPKKGVVPPCEQKEPRTITIKEEKGPLPVLGVAYRTVPESHADALPLEIAMGVVGGGESSRLYEEVVKDKKIAQAAMAGAFGFEGDGIAGAGGALLPMTTKKKELMTAVRAHLKKICDEPITQEELDKMKNQMRRSEIEGALTVENKASLLGQYAVLYGDAERINRRLEEIDAVKVEDVQRVAKKYLTPKRRISISVEPVAGGLGALFGGKEEKLPDEAASKPAENHVAKRTGPKAEAKRPEDFPVTAPSKGPLDKIPETPFTEKTLANGLKVVVVENHEVPMVWGMLGFKSGSWTEEKPGVASTAMSLLTQGTKTRDSKQLAKTLETNAIELGGSASMDTASLSWSAMLPQLDLAMELLVDVLQNPTFPKDEFEIMQSQQRMGLLVSSKEPSYLAEREMRRRMFGDHPYARTSQGELEDLDKVKVDDLKAWWGKHLRPDNAVVYIAGDITADKAFKLVEKHLGSWKAAGKYEPPALAKIPEKQKTCIYLVDQPGSTQSQIRVGHLGLTRRDAGYFVSRVLGDIFGGSFNSRLNKAIRVEKGLTYGAGGGFMPSRFAGTFRVNTFTKTESTAEAVQTILDEIKKIRTEPVTAEELSDTQAYIVGSFAGDRETPMSVVRDLWMIETQQLPKDYLQKYLAGIRSTTADSTLDAAKKLIDPDRFIIVVVGAADKVKESLEKIAPVTVVGKATSEDGDKEAKGEQGEKAAKDVKADDEGDPEEE